MTDSQIIDAITKLRQRGVEPAELIEKLDRILAKRQPRGWKRIFTQ